MVEMLKKNPAVAAEVVLGRLTQKVEEWQADKRKMTEVWQKMYDANYHKSLDHRSFYFKQVRHLSGSRIPMLFGSILGEWVDVGCGSKAVCCV
jgi:histone deacetylase complex regulatory component SIN3